MDIYSLKYLGTIEKVLVVFNWKILLIQVQRLFGCFRGRFLLLVQRELLLGVVRINTQYIECLSMLVWTKQNLNSLTLICLFFFKPQAVVSMSQKKQT